jgi:hypothetical protein
MDALARFEDALEEALESSFTRVMRSQIQPVELAKRLARAMERERTVGPGEVWAPNQYEVRLSPRDYAGLESFRQALEKRLAEYLAAYAREREFMLLNAPVVTLMADGTVGDGRPQVLAELADVPAARPSPQPQSAEMGRTARVPIRKPLAGFSLVWLADGRAQTLGRSPTTLGRALDNDVILDDRRVSRHHAQISMEAGGVWLTDLASANGTWVNGQRIVRQALKPGDVVSLGGVELVLKRGRGT